MKLSVEAKTEKFPAFVELGPCRLSAAVFADRPAGEPLDGLRRARGDFKEFDRWFGKGQMRARAGAYETRFVFQDELEDAVRVPYDAFKKAVAGLDKRDVELKIQHGILYLGQGRDCISLRELVLTAEEEKALPQFAEPGENDVKRRLNGYELAGLADVLGQLMCLPSKTQCGDICDAVYFENRTGKETGYEDLIIGANNLSVLGFGRQNLDNWGGLGIFLLPANAARKIVHAQKLLHPFGAEVIFGAKEITLDFGRFEIRARLLERECVNPLIAVPRDVKAVFEFAREQLLAFAKKAKIFGHSVMFSYAAGVFSASAGTDFYGVAGRMESGSRQKPLEDNFSFMLNADDLTDVLRAVKAERVELYFGGDEKPVWLKAGRVRYAFIPKKKEEENK